MDLSKFLRHASPDAISLEDVTKVKAIQSFVGKLQQRNIGPSGIIGKLNVLSYAQNFILHR